MLGLVFSSKLDLDSYFISIDKTASKKIGALIRSMKFLSPEVTLFLYKSTNTHGWNTVVTSGLVPVVATWNCQISYKNKYAVLLVLHLLLLLNPQLVSLFYRCYFGRCSPELAQLVPLPFCRRSTGYSDRLHDISVTIPRGYKDVYVNSFFPRTARLWNSVPIECFHLTYDLSGFKSRIYRHLLTVYKQIFCML